MHARPTPAIADNVDYRPHPVCCDQHFRRSKNLPDVDRTQLVEPERHRMRLFAVVVCARLRARSGNRTRAVPGSTRGQVSKPLICPHRLEDNQAQRGRGQKASGKSRELRLNSPYDLARHIHGQAWRQLRVCGAGFVQLALD
jgi:hypothetical protein